MNTNPLDPGIYAIDEERQKQIRRFELAVHRSTFLDERQKRNWGIMAYLLTSVQLAEAEQLIINEDLMRLNMRQKLDRLKPRQENQNK